jgi:hypothetical protein
MVKCTMISKNKGGKYILSTQRVTTTSAYNFSNVPGSITLEQIELKKKHNLVIECLTFEGRIPHIATESIKHDNNMTSYQIVLIP